MGQAEDGNPIELLPKMAAELACLRAWEADLPPFDLFIGYTSSDREIVERLLGVLREKAPSVSVWEMLGPYGIPSAKDAQDASLIPLGRSSLAVFIVSREWLAKGICQVEYKEARCATVHLPLLHSLIIKDMDAFESLAECYPSAKRDIYDPWSALSSSDEALHRWAAGIERDAEKCRSLRDGVLRGRSGEAQPTPPPEVAAPHDQRSGDDERPSHPDPDYRGIAYDIVSQGSMRVSVRLIPGCPAAPAIRRALSAKGWSSRRDLWSMTPEQFSNILIPLVRDHMKHS